MEYKPRHASGSSIVTARKIPLFELKQQIDALRRVIPELDLTAGVAIISEMQAVGMGRHKG